MKRVLYFLTVIAMTISLTSNSGCSDTKQTGNVDFDIQRKTEKSMREANKRTGMPGIVNFQEKKNLKWIYELCDKEDFICYAYLFNNMTGKVGQYLGKCIGYGIPYSTQFSNPERVANFRGDYGQYADDAVYTIAQPEPNGLFKPEGLSATWLIMIDPATSKPRPVYVEPEIIVSPFKLH